MALDSAKYTALFVEEVRDHVANLNSGLVELEKNPDGAENINAIFRAAHTIKGSSRMVKLLAITEVAHKMEDALGALRERKISHSRELADLLFRGLDAVSTMIETVAGGQPITLDTRALCESLAQAARGAQPKPTPGSAPGPAPAATAGGKGGAVGPGVSREPLPAADSIRVKTGKLDELIRLMGEVVSHQNKLKQRIREVAALEREATRLADLLGQQAAGVPFEAARSLRTGLKQLLSAVKQDKTLQDILTVEFQEKALGMRMVPVSLLFEPLHRLTRDLAAAMGKAVEFTTEGGEIELDRKMVEKLGIVYTPVEVVDFLICSVDAILRKEFSRSLSDENIHILDPFTGTGTFITRLLQSGYFYKVRGSAWLPVKLKELCQ